MWDCLGKMLKKYMRTVELTATAVVTVVFCYSRQPRLGLATYSLFVSLVCLSFCLFVCLFVCLSSSFFGNGLIYAHETLRPSYRSLLILVLISQC